MPVSEVLSSGSMTSIIKTKMLMEIVSDNKTLKNVESTTFLFQAFNKKQKRFTVVSPNMGTLKICEIGSNKGIFPLFEKF